MADIPTPDSGSTETPAGGPGAMAQLRRPVAIGGFIAFGVMLLLVFMGLFGKLSSPVVIAPIALAFLIMIAAVVINLDDVIAALRSRKTAAGMSVALSVASAAAILLSVNWIANWRYKKWDITDDKRFSLSETSLNWLARLEAEGVELRIVSFLPFQTSPYSGLPSDYKPRVVELLSLYKDECSVISVTHTEPLGEFARTVEAAQSIGISEKDIPSETVVLKYGDKLWNVGIKDLFDVAPPGPYGRGRPAVFKGEDAITTAIRNILDEKPRHIYFVTGHGERGIGFEPSACSMVVEGLKGMNFEVTQCNLAERGGVPEDADCVVIAGPTRPFAAGESGVDEVAKIGEYLDRGGRLLVMLDTLVAGGEAVSSGLERLLEKYGVEVYQDALALGAEVDQFRGVAVVHGEPNAMHEISKPLKDSRAAFFQAAVLGIGPGRDSGYEVASILDGTEGSWGERNPGQSVTFDEGEDVPGPTLLAVAVAPSASPSSVPPINPAKIVVMSDVDFISNRLVMDPRFRLYTNRDLFLNAINWIVERRENIGIIPKERERRTVVVNPTRARRIFVGAFVGPCVLMVVLGIFVWWSRSK